MCFFPNFPSTRISTSSPAPQYQTAHKLPPIMLTYMPASPALALTLPLACLPVFLPIKPASPFTRQLPSTETNTDLAQTPQPTPRPFPCSSPSRNHLNSNSSRLYDSLLFCSKIGVRPPQPSTGREGSSQEGSTQQPSQQQISPKAVTLPLLCPSPPTALESAQTCISSQNLTLSLLLPSIIIIFTNMCLHTVVLMPTCRRLFSTWTKCDTKFPALFPSS